VDWGEYLTVTQKINYFNVATRQNRRENSDRRKDSNRRAGEERRHDSRIKPTGQSKSLQIWLRSLIKVRLGVDRRKRSRRFSARRQHHQSSILTQEEISELLSL